MFEGKPWTVVGIVLLAMAAPVGIAGTVLLVLFGSDQQRAPQVVSTPGRCLVSSVADVDDVPELTSVLGGNRVQLRAPLAAVSTGCSSGSHRP